MSNGIIKYLKFSNKLADEARKISLFYFKKKFSIINKKKYDFDPVTIADIKIQKKLNRMILKSFSNHSIVGEEESMLFIEWCIDQLTEQNHLFRCSSLGNVNFSV